MAPEIGAECVSGLIGGIYDCALDPSLWPVALDRIRQELDFFNASLDVFNALLDVVDLPSFAPILSFTMGMPDRWRISDGCTVAEIGQTIGVAVTTVKTHPQRVFAKAGCRRQVELTNLARSLRQPG